MEEEFRIIEQRLITPPGPINEVKDLVYLSKKYYINQKKITEKEEKYIRHLQNKWNYFLEFLTPLNTTNHDISYKLAIWNNWYLINIKRLKCEEILK